MGLYNFKPRFVPKIRSGEKCHTIRDPRKHPDKPGDTIHCYVGLRTKKAKLIGRFPCIKVEDIEIFKPSSFCIHRSSQLSRSTVRVGGIDLHADEIEALACRDGFSSFHEMLNFWKGRLPFYGQIIHWQNSKKKP